MEFTFLITLGVVLLLFIWGWIGVVPPSSTRSLSPAREAVSPATPQGKARRPRFTRGRMTKKPAAITTVAAVQIGIRR